MTHFKAIAAMSLNRVIGRANGIPWRLPEDFKWFKKMTTGHIVVMGRKTFESIGKPLPNRETIVLTRQPTSFPGARTVPNIQAIESASDDRHIFICGGAQVYEQTLPLCSELYLTRVKQTVDGDAFFPAFEHLFCLDSVISDTPDFSIERWLRTH